MLGDGFLGKEFRVETNVKDTHKHTFRILLDFLSKIFAIIYAFKSN